MKETMLDEFRALRLPEDARERILSACRTEQRRPRRHPFYMALVAAVLTVLLCGVTLSVGAATNWFGLYSRAQSHLPATPSDVVLPQPDAVGTITTADGSLLELRCHAVTGGGDLVYADLTLSRPDGSPVIKPQDGLTLTHVIFEHATLTFADGLEKKLYCTILDDSTPDRLHIEGSILLARAELGHIGQRATLALGEAALVFLDSNNQHQMQTLDETALSVEVTVAFPDAVRSGAITPIVLEGNGVTLTITELELTGTALILRGSCDTANAKLPWLASIINGATLTLSDGNVVACGGKNGCGSIGETFIMDWQLATTVDVTQVVSLTLDGQTVILP